MNEDKRARPRLLTAPGLLVSLFTRPPRAAQAKLFENRQSSSSCHSYYSNSNKSQRDAKKKKQSSCPLNRGGERGGRKKDVVPSVSRGPGRAEKGECATLRSVDTL